MVRLNWEEYRQHSLFFTFFLPYFPFIELTELFLPANLTKMKPFVFFLFFASVIFGNEEISALYLSWYDDPTSTISIQWLTPLEDEATEILLETPDGWMAFTGT